MIHAFFRRVEVHGLDRLPRTGPVIIVANHTNGLVDGLLLMSQLPRWPRSLAKATLFRILPLRPLLKLTGAIPVYRAEDAKPGETDRAALNDATFAACRQLLREGDVVSIFPEGISHDHESLQPLRTGAARIALTSAFDTAPAESATTAFAAGLDIVPIGLAYDAKATFRSNAIVTVGDPISVAQWAGEYASDPRSAVRSCTAAITDGLRSVAPDRSHAGTPETIGRRLRFRSTLRMAASTSPHLALWVAAPVALVGAAVHAVPYQIVKQLARMPRSESIKSTVELLGSTLLFTVEWVALAMIAWRTRGRLAGAAALAAGPLSGYVAVRFAESLRDSSALAAGAS